MRAGNRYASVGKSQRFNVNMIGAAKKNSKKAEDGTLC
jgi:hypothetical protein